MFTLLCETVSFPCMGSVDPVYCEWLVGACDHHDTFQEQSDLNASLFLKGSDFVTHIMMKLRERFTDPSSILIKW